MSVADVRVTIAPASVLITATIAVDGDAASSAVVSSLGSALASAAAATSLLGITVEEAPSVIAEQLGGCAPGLLGLAPPWGDVCVPCPAGYACAFNTTVDTLATSVCPIGFFCPQGNASAPLPAPAGHASAGAGYALAVPCAPGTYAPFESTGTGECLPCPAGSECHGRAMAAPSTCAAGTYHDASGAASGARCAPCPASTYRDTTGGTSLASCTACLSTEVGPEGSVEAAACFPDPSQRAQCPAEGVAAAIFIGIGTLLGAGIASCGWAMLPHGHQASRGGGRTRQQIEPTHNGVKPAASSRPADRHHAVMA